MVEGSGGFFIFTKIVDHPAMKVVLFIIKAYQSVVGWIIKKWPLASQLMGWDYPFSMGVF
jgi:hypothetical protein